MLVRKMQSELKNLMKQYAVVTILGPRQSGKTTLTKLVCPEKAYFNLENPDVREFILADPKAFFSKINFEKGIILDEVQRAPELLSYIQVLVDEHRVPGSFILTGSHQLDLNAAILQSLAGRTALLELLPLSINELQEFQSADEYLFNGFFPAIYQHGKEPTKLYRNYIKTYVERDVRQIINIQDLDCFQRFIKLCAGRIGSTVNKESLSNDVGVSQGTIKNWLSVLGTSYLIFQLQPYFKNFGKRIIKSPKLYFLDTGLARYLLGIQSIEQLNYDKLRGGLFENLVILEVLKYLYNRGKDANIYFFRDSRNVEIDLLIQVHDRLIPIEIKSSSKFSSEFLKNINYFHQLTKDDNPAGYLVYSGDYEQKIGNIDIINFKNIDKMLEEIFS